MTVHPRTRRSSPANVFSWRRSHIRESAGATIIFEPIDLAATSVDPIAATRGRAQQHHSGRVRGCASYWFSSRITRPIVSLTGAAARYAEGQPHLRLEHTSNDEIGTLTKSFNSMVVDLEGKRVELVASREAAETASAAKSEFFAT